MPNADVVDELERIVAEEKVDEVEFAYGGTGVEVCVPAEVEVEPIADDVLNSLKPDWAARLLRLRGKNVVARLIGCDGSMGIRESEIGESIAAVAPV